MKYKIQSQVAILGVVLVVIFFAGVLFFGRHWYFELSGFLGVSLIIISILNMAFQEI